MPTRCRRGAIRRVSLGHFRTASSEGGPNKLLTHLDVIPFHRFPDFLNYEESQNPLIFLIIRTNHSDKRQTNDGQTTDKRRVRGKRPTDMGLIFFENSCKPQRQTTATNYSDKRQTNDRQTTHTRRTTNGHAARNRLTIRQRPTDDLFTTDRRTRRFNTNRGSPLRAP